MKRWFRVRISLVLGFNHFILLVLFVSYDER